MSLFLTFLLAPNSARLLCKDICDYCNTFPFHVYLDEFQNYTTKTLIEIAIEEPSKYKQGKKRGAGRFIASNKDGQPIAPNPQVIENDVK